MIEVGVPFENPTEYVPLKETHTPTFGNVVLKIDCSKIGKTAIDYIVRDLKKWLDVTLAGGDTIYAEGTINYRHYAEVWRTLDCFDVTVT